MSADRARCAWTKGPDSGISFSMCGLDIPPGSASEPPGMYEICPGCQKVVDWVEWDDVRELVGEDVRESEDALQEANELEQDEECDHKWAALHGTQTAYVCQHCEAFTVREPTKCAGRSQHDWTYAFTGESRHCGFCSRTEECNQLNVLELDKSWIMSRYNRGEVELPDHVVRAWGEEPRRRSMA